MARNTLRLTAPPDRNRLRDAGEYETWLDGLQLRLVQIQQAFMQSNERGIVVLEGWDAAGKGGLIRRLSARLDPRFLKVIPIAEPRPDEQGRHYLYRFWQGLPVPGTITVFDRSWYGRVLVERVEELIPPAAWKRAYDEINAFEAMLVDDGVRMVKLFLHVSAEEQLRRFKERLETPHKRWKLTMSDLRNLERRAEYERAINDMLAHCHTSRAPWDVIASDHKWWARCRALNRIVAVLGNDLALDPPPPDPKLARRFKSLRNKVRKSGK
jgi:AMP-polyphosphate phosphotransferase